MVKSSRPAGAVLAPDNSAAQQFYLIGEAKPAQAAEAGSAGAHAPAPASPDLPAVQVALSAEAEPQQTRAAGSLMLDAATQSSPGQPGVGPIFPADDPPVVADSQILLALKDGSLFLLSADMISGKTLELRDALANVGIVFDDPAQGSDVLEDYGLSGLLGGWLLDLQALTGTGTSGDLGGHNGIF